MLGCGLRIYGNRLRNGAVLAVLGIAATARSDFPTPLVRDQFEYADCGSAGQSCKADSACCGSLLCSPSGTCESACRIGRRYYPAGAWDPQNSCRSCQPGVNATAFTVRLDGSACEADACSVSDFCLAGICQAGPPLTCSSVGTTDLNGPCDDCNLNGVADACEGEPTRGVPASCVEPNGGCGEPLWSCSENWNLGGLYPNNTGLASYNVTLAGPTTDYFLDVDVLLDTLRVVNGAVLRLVQSGPVGDLDLVAPGGLLLEGTLDGFLPSQVFLGAGRSLRIAGPLVIQPGGILNGVASRTSGVALLEADEVFVKGGTCNCPQTSGGSLTVAEGVNAQIWGDLVIEGSATEFCSTSCFGPRGGVAPPPKLQGAGSSSTTVGGSVTFSGASAVSFDTAARGAASFPAELLLGGDFNQFAIDPQLFYWAPDARLVLEGTAPQTVEAAGTDMGPFPHGLLGNFALGVVEVDDDRVVTFTDGFDNNGWPGDEEAIYLDTLILRAGSQITVDRCKIFYHSLVDEGASIFFTRGGRMAQIAD